MGYWLIYYLQEEGAGFAIIVQQAPTGDQALERFFAEKLVPEELKADYLATPIAVKNW